MKVLILAMFVPACLIAAPALAQAGQDSAGHIVSQPARDVGVAKTKIPPILEEASVAPYNAAGLAKCTAIASEIAALSKELGPDYGAAPGKAKSNKERIAAAGGRSVIDSLIPFRGLVREVSGAGPAERRLQAAVDAGIARRGFLRGLQSARGCRR